MKLQARKGQPDLQKSELRNFVNHDPARGYDGSARDRSEVADDVDEYAIRVVDRQRRHPLPGFVHSEPALTLARRE